MKRQRIHIVTSIVITAFLSVSVAAQERFVVGRQAVAVGTTTVVQAEPAQSTEVTTDRTPVRFNPAIRAAPVVRVQVPVDVRDPVPVVDDEPTKDPQPAFEPNETIQIKFHDDSVVRFRNGVPTTLQGSALRSRLARAVMKLVESGKWSPLFSPAEEDIDQLRVDARKLSGEELPDLNNWFALRLPPAADAHLAIALFNRLAEVEHASRMPTMAPPPAEIPDYEDPANTSGDFQGYLDPADQGGIDVRYAWTLPGGTGANMQVCDIEHDFNPFHVDLMPYGSIELVGGESANDNNDFRYHGTAVMSILRGNDEGFGVTGIVHDATAKFAPQHVAGWFTEFNTADAVMRAIFAVDFGDVIVLEAQMFGPNAPMDGTQFGMVPSEWDRAVHDVINAATGVGRIVVEAAGNGTQNLDSGTYTTNNNGHYPFLAGNETDAIMVGAGFAPDTPVPAALTAAGITSLARMKTNTSNFGQRVDVQGWGNNVVAAGYGDLLKEGESAYYTQFSGTSSATAITAGAVASLQGICKARWGRTLWAFEMRNLLKIASLPQVRRPDTAAATPTLNIGPLPNLKVAADLIHGTLPAPVISPMPADGDPPITPANPKVITLDLDPSLDPTVLPDAFILLYTTDGTDPDMNGWGYDNGGVGFIHTPGDTIELTESTTIKTRVVLPNLQNDGLLLNIWATSLPVGAVYGPSIPAPVVDIAGGAYPNTLWVDLRTGMGDSPYIIYTLDGSEPDINSNHWEGDPTQVWTNTMSDNGQRLNVFAYGTTVTLKARNVVYYGSGVGEVAGEMLVQTYTQSFSTSP